jgi:hypothetical protein
MRHLFWGGHDGDVIFGGDKLFIIIHMFSSEAKSVVVSVSNFPTFFASSGLGRISQKDISETRIWRQFSVHCIVA